MSNWRSEAIVPGLTNVVLDPPCIVTTRIFHKSGENSGGILRFHTGMGWEVDSISSRWLTDAAICSGYIIMASQSLIQDPLVCAPVDIPDMNSSEELDTFLRAISSN